ncbi:MAG: phage tail assembly chaperone [Devosia sp.]
MNKIDGQLIDCLLVHLAGGRQPVPEAGRLAWGWFIDLCRTRTSNGYGPNPISFAEIEAYARLYRWPLEPRHVGIILALDRVWLEKARAGEGGAAGAMRPQGQEATPESFDAMFG